MEYALHEWLPSPFANVNWYHFLFVPSQSYFYNDDTFNFNYAQAKAAVGNFKEAEEVSAVYRLLLFDCDVILPYKEKRTRKICQRMTQ